MGNINHHIAGPMMATCLPSQRAIAETGQAIEMVDHVFA